MAKNIVLCSDGTGNQDIKNRGTNVFKLYEAVDIQGGKTRNMPKQVAFYDDGVGTSRVPLVKLIGGAFGYGFSRNVKKLYRELVNVYEPGDGIFLIGFSRGAYTVRSLSGMIQYCGILDINDKSFASRTALTEQIDKCWDDFRENGFAKGVLSAAKRSELRKAVPPPEVRKIRTERRTGYKAVNPGDDINIEFIGVWDTVGAIGAPFDGVRNVINYFYPIWFNDNTLGHEVKKACQALSIDDERRTFHPELWNEQWDEMKKKRDNRITQVWFAGVHSNVGGGYPKQGMSLVALDWMMEHAKNAGLHFIANDRLFVHAHQDVHDKLYDSRTGMGLYYRWEPRNIWKLCHEHRIQKPKIHISVFERIANARDGYSPGNIPFDCEIDTTGSLLPWPANNAPQQIITIIGNNNSPIGKATSTMEEMGTVINSGKRSYKTFVTLTIITAFIFILSLIVYFSSGTRTSLLTVFIFTLSGTFLLAICGAIIYSWAENVDSSLYKKYSEFWHGRRGLLRSNL